MMKNFTLLLTALFTLSLSTYAVESDEDYMDLLAMLVDGDYEKCLKKCEKYKSKDETKRDPLPYLYSSMALYEMSRDHQYSENYPRAYTNALNDLSRYRRMDKEFMYKDDSEEFIEKIKFEIAEQIENYKLMGTTRDYKKAKSLAKKLRKIDPDDLGATLLTGIYYIRSKDKSTGKKYIKEGLETLESLGTETSFSDLTPSQQYFLKEALVDFYTYKKEKDLQQAEEVLLMGKEYYQGDNENLSIENYEDYSTLLEEID